MAWTFYDRFGRERQATVTTHPVGSILSYGGSVAPPGWLICDGAELPKINYPELATTLGTTYNVNGSTPISDAVNNFRLPDFRGHSPIGPGTPATGTPGAGVTYTHGTKTGERLHALTVGEVPRHTHGPGTLATNTQAATNVDSKTTGVSVNSGTTGISVNGDNAIISVTSTGSAHTHSLVGPSGAADTSYFGIDLSNVAGGDVTPFYDRTDVFRTINATGLSYTSPAATLGNGLAINAAFFDRIYLNSTIPGGGSEHTHGISQAVHTHGITDGGHIHGTTDPGHFHTVPAHSHTVTTGVTENGTAAGLGTGSPTHNNVGPVLPTNFIIKF